MTGIEEWGMKLNEEVYKKWIKHPRLKAGFKIFYTKLRKDPPIMIISLNPGGKKDSFEEDRKRFEKKCFEIKDENFYLENKNRPFAKAIIKLFENHEGLLKKSVAIPILFFRSKSIKQWKNDFFGSAPEERCKIEFFCYEKTIEIIKMVKPKALLIIGFNTYEALISNELLLPLTIEKIKFSMYGKSKQRIWIRMEWNNIPIFCVRHLTGSHIKKEDKQETKKEFNDFCKEYSIN